MCVHATHNAKIQVIMQSHLPPPSLKTIWNQLSSSLYLPGVAWVDSLTVMFIQRIDRCNAPEKSGQKKKQRKACLSTSHFLLENINPRGNHFQFTSHDCKYFLNFCLECSPWNKLALPKECEVYPLQSLRCDETLATRIPCLVLQHDYCI